jgi:predicted small lipoprotein YifL
MNGYFSLTNGILVIFMANYYLRAIQMRPILFFILFSLLIAGCGTKGPLYIPEQQYPLPPETSE